MSVPTRLTAEQFWPEWCFSTNQFDHANGIGVNDCIAFAEAFRDKSEALNWKRQESCSECDGDGCAKCCRGCAGLREEIERLKAQIESAKTPLMRDVIQELERQRNGWTAEIGLKFAAQHALTELRAKLAEQEGK